MPMSRDYSEALFNKKKSNSFSEFTGLLSKEGSKSSMNLALRTSGMPSPAKTELERLL